MSVHKISDIVSEFNPPENLVQIDAWFTHAEKGETVAVVDLDTLLVIPVKKNLMADPLVAEAIKDVLRKGETLMKTQQAS